MKTNNERVIERSKVKVVLLLLASIGFVAAGLYLFNMDDAQILAQRGFKTVAFVHGIGIVSVVFFGLCTLVWLRKLLPWSEVSDVRLHSFQMQKMLVIMLKDPQPYMERGNAFKRMLNRANTRMCGSTVVISATALKINFEDLLSAFGEYRHRMGVSA